MNDLLNNPAVQAGIVPFGVALIAGLVLARTRWIAVASPAVVLVLLLLTIGFSIEPLTSSKKLILATLGVSLLALLFDGLGQALRKAIVAVLVLLAALACVWVLERILGQKTPAAAWLLGAAAVGFVLLGFGGALTLHGDGLRGAVIGACLGWSSGAMAVLGASGFLGQLGIALGTASAALALVQMFRGQGAGAGWSIVVPGALGACLIVLLASATGELRWPALLPLVLVAPLVRMVPAGERPAWLNAFVFGFAGLVPAAAAVVLAWWLGASSAG